MAHEWIQDPSCATLLSDWVWIRALQQSHGTGQRERLWLSPLGSCSGTLMLSFPYAHPLVSLVVSLSVAEAIEHAASGTLRESITLKWPNDLMIKGHKLGGILTEVVEKNEMPPWILIGIGININVSVSQLGSVAQERPITTLLEACGTSFDLERLWERIHASLDHKLRALYWADTEAHCVADLNARLLWIGETVWARMGKKLFQGRFGGLYYNARTQRTEMLLDDMTLPLSLRLGKCLEAVA
jgi:BirA family biotin operon repressor/biotin-[acetyl-CoA-carboxylase] ligase